MKKVIVYCASGYASKVTYLLDDEKYDVIAWADSNPETWSGMSIWGGHNVISPDKINDYEFDLIIVSVSEYFDTIKRDLVEKYNIDSDKIIAYQPNEKGIKWLDERISVLRKCIDVIKERNIQGEMAELGVYKGDFSRLLNKYLPDKKIYLFDTFNGFCSTRDTVNTEDLEVFKDTSVQYVLSRMEHPEKCIVKKGYFPDTTDGVDEKFVCEITPDNTKVLYFKHRTLLPYMLVSSGTKVLILFFYWYKQISLASFVFIDEFNAFYHFELGEKVLKLAMKASGQVLLTSHNTNLLSNKIMRPDCYFILTKDRITSFANATARELREGHNLEKLFISGEFNG